MRVFVGEPGFEYKENFRTLSNAALAGGVTSVVSMPNTFPVIDNVSMVDFLKRRGRDKSRINIFPAASLTRNAEGEHMSEFGLLKKKGIIAFTDGIKTIQNPQLMSRIMNFASQSKSLIMQHAEDNILAKDGLINDGEISTRLGLQGIPALAEKIIVERDLSFLDEYFCRYHISQVSSEKTVSIIRMAKSEGKIFTAGVSINNLSLNENDIGDFKTFLKLSPPLRTENDRLSLIDGLNDGSIDVIVSDHKPEDEESKRLTFEQATTGAAGVETLLPLALELFHNKSIKLEKLIASMTSNPAKILQLNKGSLDVGSDADLCLLDINKAWIVKKNELKSKSKNTPVENRTLQGQITKTFVKGKIAFERD
jgi:dihydroorotase